VSSSVRSAFRQQWLGASIGLCALFVALGGPAAASGVASAGVRLITGADVKDGSLQAKDLSAAARKSLRGHAGSRGPAGPAGAAGGRGAAGAQGTPGLSGSQGTTGASGVTGLGGSTGSTGPTGTIGVTGPTGTFGGTFTSPNGNNSISVTDSGIVLTTPAGTLTLDSTKLSTSVSDLELASSGTARLSGSAVRFGTNGSVNCNLFGEAGNYITGQNSPATGNHAHPFTVPSVSSSIFACQ
jgi:hypothetical protein